jgi:hypothetical protein
MLNLRSAFAGIQTLSENAQGQSFGARHCFLARASVRHRTGNLRNLGDPASIGLLVDLNIEGHGRNMNETRVEHKPW